MTEDTESDGMALLSGSELRLVMGALREVLGGAYAVPEWEFQTLLGCDRADAEDLMKRLRSLVESS